MNQPSTFTHPLFDECSLYSKLRASVGAEDKMRGYCHWLWARRGQRGSQGRKTSVPRAKGLRQLRGGGDPPPTEEELLRIACHLEGKDFTAVHALAVLPDGRLASAGKDGTIQLWNVRTDRAVYRELHRGSVWSLAVLPDGRLASGGEDGVVRGWDNHSDEVAGRELHQGSVWALTALPDGRLASGGDDGAVRVWDLRSGKVISHELHRFYVRALAVLPCGRLASASFDSTVKVFDPDTGEAISHSLDRSSFARALAVLPSGRLALGCTDGKVHLWDVRSGEVVSRELHQGSLGALVVMPEGWLASGGKDGAVRLWHVGSDRVITCEPRTSPVTALTVLPDGRLASAVGYDGALRVWDVNTEQTRTGRHHFPGLRVLAVLPVHGFVFGPVDRERGEVARGPFPGRLLLVQEPDGTHSFTLEPARMALGTVAHLPPGADRYRCRALFLEPEVLSQLAQALGQAPVTQASAALLTELLGRNTVGGNKEVARILSAVPELEGDITAGGEATHHPLVPEVHLSSPHGELELFYEGKAGLFRFHRLPVPDAHRGLPARSEPLTVVLAFSPADDAR